MSDLPSRPAPILDEISSVFWEAAAENRLLIQRCRSCDRYQFYARAHCSHCFSTKVEWFEASRRAHLHTFSVVSRTASPIFQPRLPYIFGIVELQEGPRMTVNVIDTPADLVRCNLPVEIVFINDGGQFSLPCAQAAHR